jgi:hypothetical protein
MKNAGPFRGSAGVELSIEPLNFRVETHLETPLELLSPMSPLQMPTLDLQLQICHIRCKMLTFLPLSLT